MSLNSIKILDVKIDNINYIESLKKIEEFLESSQQHYIVTPNPEIILAAQQNKELKNILNNADLKLPDGFGLILASKFKIKKRVTGTDLMIKMLNKFKNKKFKFIINKQGLTSKQDLINYIRQNNINIDEENPDIIFIALGCPLQELWIKQNINNFPNTKIFMAVGGGVDFLTGKQKRAPKLFQQTGFEWLWRLLKQPSRIKRIYNATFKFIWKVIIT